MRTHARTHPRRPRVAREPVGVFSLLKAVGVGAAGHLLANLGGKRQASRQLAVQRGQVKRAGLRRGFHEKPVLRDALRWEGVVIVLCVKPSRQMLLSIFGVCDRKNGIVF